MVKNIAIGTGRRKTAVARVFVRDGSGKIVVNGKDAKDYFDSAEQLQLVNQPLLVLDCFQIKFQLNQTYMVTLLQYL